MRPANKVFMSAFNTFYSENSIFTLWGLQKIYISIRCRLHNWTRSFVTVVTENTNNVLLWIKNQCCFHLSTHCVRCCEEEQIKRPRLKTVRHANLPSSWFKKLERRCELVPTNWGRIIHHSHYTYPKVQYSSSRRTITNPQHQSKNMWADRVSTCLQEQMCSCQCLSGWEKRLKMIYFCWTCISV